MANIMTRIIKGRKRHFPDFLTIYEKFILWGTGGSLLAAIIKKYLNI